MGKTKDGAFDFMSGRKGTSPNGSGCGTIIAVLLVIGFISAYWYVFAIIALLFLARFCFSAYTKKRKQSNSVYQSMYDEMRESYWKDEYDDEFEDGEDEYTRAPPVTFLGKNNFNENKSIIKDNQKEITYIAENTKERNGCMYDREKGIYPAGQYLVGRDIPLGGYILTARNGKTASVTLYPSYTKYKNEEDELMWVNFQDDFHISLMEEKNFLVVEDADIQKI